MSEKLSENFTIVEYIKSQTVTRHGIDNSLSDEHLENVKKLFDKCCTINKTKVWCNNDYFWI